MAQELPIADDLTLTLDWPETPGSGGNPLVDETVARVEMSLGATPVTSYQSDRGDRGRQLPLPTYFMAEWLAENWWAFLFEPRKQEREDAEADYRMRHWLGAARNGFALPDVMFAPTGDAIEIVARPSYLRFARLNFTEAASALVPRERVRVRLAAFIDAVIERLDQKGINRSPAHDAWSRVQATSADQEMYCRLIGSLGLCPYVDHPDIDSALERVSDNTSETMLGDLCDATNVATFQRTATLTREISRTLEKMQPVKVGQLLRAAKPSDTRPRAYEWGYRSTDAARKALGIANDDPFGCQKFFDHLKFDLPKETGAGSDNGHTSLVSAAVVRHEENMRLAVLGTSQAQKRFAAARASFLAWSPKGEASHLVTTAKTREQQASRAFAAELLAPVQFLHKRLGEGKEVSSFAIDEVSQEIGAAPSVVRYQVQNDGYFITEAA